jgi:two-component system invasion response regulator UvrY
MHAEELFARRAFKGGASGYITKNSPRAEIIKAINKVSQGEIYVSPALAAELAIDLRRGWDRQPHEALSDREFEVLRLIASGRAVGEIAGLLSLSDGTISTYRARILEKMGMKTNAELTRYAIKNNLVD